MCYLTKSPTETAGALLYSCTRSLILVFTFEYASDTGHAASSTDPYILAVRPDEWSRRALSWHPLSGVIVRRMAYGGFHQGLATDMASDYIAGGFAFYQVMLLTSALEMYEALYVRRPEDSEIELCEPDVRSKIDAPKSPARLLDEFVVPDEAAYEEELDDSISLEHSADDALGSSNDQTILTREHWTSHGS